MNHRQGRSYSLAAIFGVLLFISQVSLALAQLPTGLVSWWDGDLVSGDTAFDLANGNNGTLVNGAATAPGKVGNAFSFDGVDDFVFIPSSASLVPANAVSVDLWAKINSMPDEAAHLIDAKLTGVPKPNGLIYGLFVLGDGRAGFGVTTTSGLTSAFGLTNIVGDGQFHHLAGTWDGSEVKLHVDGVLEGSALTSGALVSGSAAEIVIGDHNPAIQIRRVHGLLDEVQIFHRALSATEIQGTFLAGSGGVSKVKNRIYWSEDDKIRTANVQIPGGQTPSTRIDIKDLLVGQPTCCGRDLILDEASGKMYWTNTDSFTFGIRRSGIDIPTGQTASNRTDVEFLVPGQMAGIALDLAGSKMYWTQTFNGNVRRSNLDIPAGQNANNRTDIEDLVVGESINRRGIALDRAAGKMYFVDGDGGRIQRANLDGSNLEHLVTGLGGYDPFALDLDLVGGKIYFTRGSFGGPIKIQRANLDGSNVEDVVILTAPPLGIVLDVPGGKIYWGTGGGGGADKVQRANLEIPAGQTASTRTDVEDIAAGLNGVTGLALGFTPLVADFDTVDFFLHGSGATANPSTLFLNANTPTATTAKSKDSAGIKFSGGNLWTQIGTWMAQPALSSGTLSTLSNLATWLGLRNSDDQGMRFDLRAEVYKNSTLVASGEIFCIQGVTTNPNNAKQVAVSFNSSSPTTFNGTTDVLSLKVLTRIGTNGSGAFCGGHSSATGLRLYFDAVSRPSKFAATFSQ